MDLPNQTLTIPQRVVPVSIDPFARHELESSCSRTGEVAVETETTPSVEADSAGRGFPQARHGSSRSVRVDIGHSCSLRQLPSLGRAEAASRSRQVMVAAARETLTRPSTPAQSRVGASATTVSSIG